MLRIFLKVATRNLFRQTGYNLLNMIGLSLGIACGLLLTLHIKEELSYERNYPKHARIFRVVTTEWSKSHPPLAAEMRSYFSEIENIARFASAGTSIVNSDPLHKIECDGYFADSTAEYVFDLRTIVGNTEKALAEPYALVITRSMSEKLFGKKDPIGRKLVFNNKEEGWVRAVVEDPPPNTHLQFDYLVSMSTFYKNVPQDWTSSRFWMFGWTYVLLKNRNDLEKVQSRMKDFWIRYRGTEARRESVLEEAKNLRFQPLTDIHLKSNLIQEMKPNSSIIYVYIFIAGEILILIIACINFINLFTTQSIKRLKEVSIRKILGAQKAQLVLQFLGEAFILTIISGIGAILIYEAVLPFYNKIAGKQVESSAILQPLNFLIVIGMIGFTGILSGLFPAIFISGFKAIGALKGRKFPMSTATIFRKSLVVFQFVVSGFLIISTILIYQQMKLFRNKQLGFDKDQVIVVNMYGNFKDKVLSAQDVIKNNILTNPDILSVGKSSNLIGDDLSVESVTPVNAPEQKEFPTVRVFRIDDQYLKVLNIPLKEGRNFSVEYHDSASFIINEKAAQIMELKNPLGSLVRNSVSGVEGKVIGVIKDFHFTSLHNQIEPLVLEYNPQWTNNLLIKFRPEKTASVINFLRKKIEDISPGTLFSYSFLDERIAGLYKKEDNMSQVLKAFSILAIVIACIGLFGLAAHASEIRTKEIGIRKVIGASVTNLIRLLSKDFALLVLIGNLVAWPIAWYAVNKWLNEFTYKIEISWQVFVFAALVTFVIAMITVGFHCIRTARANPVKSLRTE